MKAPNQPTLVGFVAIHTLALAVSLGSVLMASFILFRLESLVSERWPGELWLVALISVGMGPIAGYGLVTVCRRHNRFCGAVAVAVTLLGWYAPLIYAQVSSTPEVTWELLWSVPTAIFKQTIEGRLSLLFMIVSCLAAYRVGVHGYLDVSWV